MLTIRQRDVARALIAAAFAAALSLSSPLHAEAPPGGASAANIDRAKALLRAGNGAFREGDFAAAREAYQQAYALRPGYDTAGSLGEALLQLGRHAEAARYLEECVRTLPATVPAALRERMSTAFAEARAQAGALRIAVNVAGAEVLVDGSPVGTSPLAREVFVTPGTRNITATWRGERVSLPILVTKGSSESVSLSFEVGPSMPLVIAGGATGLAGIGAGLVFAILSNGKAGDADTLRDELQAASGPAACDLSQNQGRCSELAGLRDDEALFGNVSAWSFIGGGAMLAGTAVYFFMASAGEPAPQPATGVRAVPIVTAKGGGLMLGGTW